MNRVELLAPAGNFSKLKTAIYYGADAVYVGGKSFSLRALSDNFTDEELTQAVKYVHEKGKKIYVTVNIFARNADFEKAKNYFVFLQNIGVDAAIVSDTGLIYIARKVAPKLKIHLSTQANTTNKYTEKFWQEYGLARVILARELSLKEIGEISAFNEGLEIEAFIHGAMCISYSGRCLMSNYFTGRDSNRGECVQACRWEYSIREKSKDGDFYDVQEDGRGTYIMNSEYYLATVINAYRRAIDDYYKIGEKYKENPIYNAELCKTAHRAFTTAYMLGDNKQTVNYDNSQSKGDSTFIALVLGYDKENKTALVEMRNRFKEGDMLEVLSPSEQFNEKITVGEMYDEKGERVSDAKIVQQKLRLKTDIVLNEGDILRSV